MIGTAQVGKSAFEAKEMGILRSGDGITMNRDRVLADAKAKGALKMAENYTPPKDQTISLPGPNGLAALKTRAARSYAARAVTPYDQVVSLALGKVLTGGNTDFTETITDKDILKLERTVFIELWQEPGLARAHGTHARGRKAVEELGYSPSPPRCRSAPLFPMGRGFKANSAGSLSPTRRGSG